MARHPATDDLRPPPHSPCPGNGNVTVPSQPWKTPPGIGRRGVQYLVKLDERQISAVKLGTLR